MKKAFAFNYSAAVRIAALITAALMLAVFAAGCVKQHTPDETPAPEEAPSAVPTAEPTASPTEPAEETVTEPVPGADDPGELAFWPMDFDKDGQSGFFKVDMTALTEEGRATPYVMLNNGVRVDAPFEVSTSHAGMGTYGWTRLGAERYLLYYRASWYGGMCGDYYCLLYTENGQFKVFREREIEYDISSERPLPEVNEQEILDFYNELNEIWANSDLYFTTDTDIAAKQLYNARTGRRYGGDTSLPIFYSIFARPFEGKLTSVIDDWFICIENLDRFDGEFGWMEGYDPDAAMDEKLSFANDCMARNTAIYAAIAAVNVENPENASVIDSGTTYGIRHYVIRVENCPTDNGPAVMLVTVDNGLVTDISAE